MKKGRTVGVILPVAVYQMIEEDLKAGDYLTISDWVRMACKEFYEKRKRERSGGGALAKGSKRRGRRAPAQAPPIVSRQ